MSGERLFPFQEEDEWGLESETDECKDIIDHLLLEVPCIDCRTEVGRSGQSMEEHIKECMCTCHL